MKKNEARDINSLISQRSLEQDSNKRLLEAELLHRSHQIRSFHRFKHDLVKDGESEAAAFKRISAKRDQLDERIRALRNPSDDEFSTRHPEATLIVSRRELVAPRFGHAGEGGLVFGTEGCVTLPSPSEGINIVPNRSETYGEILTTELGPLGSISFGSSGRDPSGEFIGLGKKSISETEFIWLRNWRNLVLFPCTTTASFLTYNFEVNVRAAIFRDAGRGLIMCFASVGEAPSASPTSNITVDKDGGWPLIADVEEPGPSYNGHYGFISGSATVERTFEVPAGRTPAVAIIVGFVVRLVGGGLRLTFAGDSGIGFSQGSVCYRYTPIPILAPS